MQSLKERKEREGELEEVIPGLSQNPLNHSFMSASLFNESQRRFLVRKHLSTAGKQGMLESAEIDWKRTALRELGGKSSANSDYVACCHQALKNRVDRFLCKKRKRKFHWSCALLPAFQSCPHCFNFRMRQKNKSQYANAIYL